MSSDASEIRLRAALARLAADAPPGPTAACIRARLARRTRIRGALLAAAVIALAALPSLIRGMQRSVPPVPLPSVPGAEALLPSPLPLHASSLAAEDAVRALLGDAAATVHGYIAKRDGRLELALCSRHPLAPALRRQLDRLLANYQSAEVELTDGAIRLTLIHAG